MACCLRRRSVANLIRTRRCKNRIVPGYANYPMRTLCVAAIVLTCGGPLVAEVRPGMLEQRLQYRVRSLGYSDTVVEDLIRMTRAWNLTAMENKLVLARQDQRGGAPSQGHIAQAEEDAAKAVALAVKTDIHISASETGHELPEVVQTKNACCLGFSQLFYVLGTSIGLRVKVISVPETASGPLPQGVGHVACLLELTDGSAMIVDLMGCLGSKDCVTSRFQFERTYCQMESYWELRQQTAALGLPRKNSGSKQRRSCGRSMSTEQAFFSDRVTSPEHWQQPLRRRG